MPVHPHSNSTYAATMELSMEPSPSLFTLPSTTPLTTPQPDFVITSGTSPPPSSLEDCDNDSNLMDQIAFFLISAGINAASTALAPFLFHQPLVLPRLN